MAEENLGAAPEETPSGSWRGRGASIGAIIATILLLGLIVMVTVSNRERDEALGWERHAYDVMHMTRVVDATIARSEVTLGQFVLSEKEEAGRQYYDDWRLAGRQIQRLKFLTRQDPDQRGRVEQLETLYRKRGQELAPAGMAAATEQESGGVPYFYQAVLSRTGPDLRAKLDEIAASERQRLRERMQQTQMFGRRAGRFTEWLGWLGILIGAGAVLLGYVAYNAISERVAARREAENEATRAFALEQAVEERTRELKDANELLRTEAAERAVAEAQLRQIQKLEAVGRLTGGIAHDFNNMLAVVVGGIDMARRKLGGDKRDVEAQLDNAMEGATRAAALTRRLLAFARAEPLVPEAVAPADLIQGMFELIDRSIGELIKVRTRFPEEPWHVFVDVNQLENAIVNLAVNARDAMGGEGEIVIAIDNVPLRQREVRTLPPGDYVRISVEDKGTGISAENLERVFEPFFTTKPVGKGTGLGLSQIFSFARESGGDVTIDSTEGVGTAVSIYLPRSRRGVEAAAREGLAATGSAFDNAPLPLVCTVLVVDDDPRVLRSTVDALAELGHRPIACGSGAEALETLAREEEVDLVITDVMMPGMTGPKLAQAIAERYPGTAVLFVTGYVGETSEADELSGYPILRKPFTISVLTAAMEKVMGRRASGSPPASTSAAAE